jgi:hypothetical protein
MKTPKPILAFVAIVPALLALMLAPAAKAADYAVQKTFWSFAGTWTNDVNVVTNLNAAIDVTQFTDFAIQLVAKTTNAAVAGGISVVWETSLDGSNWPTSYTNFAGAPLVTGWFSIPITNAVTTVWSSNITANAIGYWRIRSLTNASSGSFTNIALTGYVKPKRTARDQ